MSPLATGGMARIYIARSTGIGSFERHVVLKLITPERANDVTAVQMFLDEARLAASLNHQNVAQVFEVGEDNGIHYLAMEYVHGQDLRALLAKAGSQGTRVPLELALTVVAGASAGLHHAHERRGPDGTPLGIVHRDVSPSNLMVGYDGSVKLLDFGIAKATARSFETQSGIIKGKFAYMAPEQCRGRGVDARSDVFSLGIILYEISTQHRCFRADSDFDTMHRIVTGDIVRPSRVVQNYPAALEAIVMKALAVEAAQRYQSAGHLLEAVEAFAVASRMSLSTMSLGRFMREMFGETPEPWLNTGRVPLQPPKETTISTTNSAGRGAGTGPEIVVVNPGVLALPRGESEPGVGDDPQWNAKSYPAMQPAPAEGGARASSPRLASFAKVGSASGAASVPGMQPLPVPPARVTFPDEAATINEDGLDTILVPPSGPVPSALPPAPRATPLPPPEPSASAPMPAAIPIPTTQQGYAAAGQTGQTGKSDVAFRFEGSSPDIEDVRPSRRPLFIAGAILFVIAAAIIAMTIGGSGGVVPTPEPTTAPAPVTQPSAPETQTPTQPPAPPPPPPRSPVAVTPVAETIRVNVTSDPPGADVQIHGKSIGTTPLKTTIKRGTGVAHMKIARAKHYPVTVEVDQSEDVERMVQLSPIDKQDDAKRIADDAKRIADDERKKQKRLAEQKRLEATRLERERLERERLEKERLERERLERERKKKLKCQPPGQRNPFDTSCDGAPCPVCKDK